MPKTIDDALTDARDILNDSAGDRYTDAQMVSYLNNAISMTKAIRPDAFLLGEALPEFSTSDLNSSTDFPLPEIFYQSFVYFLAGHAELRDDEFTVDGRAMTLLASYRRNLTGSV